MPYLFTPPASLPPGAWYRFDTASGSDSPATLLTPGGGTVLDARQRVNSGGRLPRVATADVPVLYLKALDYRGPDGAVVVGSTPVELPGAAQGGGGSGGGGPVDLSAYLTKADAETKYLTPSGASAAYAQRHAEVVELTAYLQGTEKISDFTSGTTSVHAILKRALDDLSTRWQADGIRRAVRVPAGRYACTDRVVPPPKGGFGIVGDGRSETIFVLGPENQFLAPVGDPNEGGWNPTINPYYKDLLFRDFTIDAQAHTATSWGSGNKKAFSMGHVKDAEFIRVRAIGTHSTAFGIDYNENNYFVECSAINCGRGMLTEPVSNRIGAGSGFGLGSGTYYKEMATLINCVAVGCGSNGFFFEQLHRLEAVTKSTGFKMIGCWSEGNNIGVSDAGGYGTQIIGCHLLDNLTAGFRLGGTQTGFQGGTDGVITACTITGNGVGVQLDACADGGYLISQNIINRNVGAGVRVPPTYAIGRGIVIAGNRMVENGGSGVSLETAIPVVGIALRDNEIRRNGRDAAATYRDGITAISPLVKPIIAGNRVTQNAGRCLALRGTTTQSISPRIRHNDFDGSPGGGVLLEHVISDAAKIVDNVANAASTVQNLCTLPTLPNDTAVTSWTSTGMTKTRSTDSYTGQGSAQGVYTSGVNRLGTQSRTVTENTIYTCSVHIKAAAGETVYIYTHLVTTNAYLTGRRIVANGTWQRLDMVALVPTGVTSIRVGAGLGDAAVGDVLLVDGANITIGGELWPYIDGAQTNCAWDGTAYQSTSTLTIPT